MELTSLSNAFWVSPQIVVSDLAGLANDGYTDVICYRPDDEHPEETSSARIAQACEVLGLSFHYHPIVPGEPFEDAARMLAKLMFTPDIKICAYCRSGARATKAFDQASEMSRSKAV